jgi:hypothetical protein
MLAKAKTSCLTPGDVKKLRFQPYEENHDLDPETLFPRYAGFQLPYFKLDGSVDEGFYRFRLLQTQPSRGFAAITEEPKKPRRYTQPLNTQCGVYLPPLFDDSWAVIAKNPEIEIIITEGELKAACACKVGFPTIGLGGVYNWRSSKQKQELLPILEKFNWLGRKVVICFDSDAMTNPMVRMAASRLAYILAMRGAHVKFAHIPEGEEAEDGTRKKQGLDDFIYSYVVAATSSSSSSRQSPNQKKLEALEAAGLEAGTEAFYHVLQEAEELGPGQELHRLNDEVAIIRTTGEVVELYTGNVYSQSVFSDTVYRNRKYQDHADDSGRMVTKYAAKEWIGWRMRNDVAALAYEPACTNMLTANGEYNTWYAQRWPLTPKRTGTMAPWEKLFKQVFGSLTPEHQTWVRQWLAYPIQKPGTKLYTAMLVWGKGQGTGKTLIGELMEAIYGRNFGTVDHDQLSSPFTEWAHDKQFILGDEISIGDKRGLANKLKDMITRRSVIINIKNRKTYRVRDCINYYFTSNSESALYIENADRRYFIHHVDQQTLDKEEYIAIRKWWDSGGAARLFYYFQNEVDLTGFEPTAHAPITHAKLEMAVAGRSEIEDWAHDLVRDPDSILRGDKTFDLWRTEDLLDVWEAKDGRKGKAGNKALSAALSNAGAFRIANGQNGAIINGARSRLWALRNVDQYRKMGAAPAGKMYEAERPQQRIVGDSRKFAAGKRVQ